MKIALIIVVAIVVSAIGYVLFYWPLPGGIFGIFIVALIGAALGLAVVLSFHKPDTLPPTVFSRILGATAVALVLLVVVVQLVPGKGGKEHVKVTIDCSSDKYEVEEIEVFRKGTVTWELVGTVDTKVTIHSFRHKYLKPWKINPIVDADLPKLEGYVPDPIGPVNVKEDLNIFKRHYKYSYTCAPPAPAKPFTVDPMFYVPK